MLANVSAYPAVAALSCTLYCSSQLRVLNAKTRALRGTRVVGGPVGRVSRPAWVSAGPLDPTGGTAQTHAGPGPLPGREVGSARQPDALPVRQRALAWHLPPAWRRHTRLAQARAAELEGDGDADDDFHHAQPAGSITRFKAWPMSAWLYNAATRHSKKRRWLNFEGAEPKHHDASDHRGSHCSTVPAGL